MNRRDEPSGSIVRRLAAGFAVLWIITAVAGMTWFSSECGQNRARRFLEDALSAPGQRQVTIGEFSIRLSGRAHVRDVKIRRTTDNINANGESVIEIDTIELDVLLLPLLYGETRIQSLDASGVKVNIRVDEDGKTNVVELFARDSRPDHDERLISLTDLAIRDGQVQIQRAAAAPEHIAIALEELEGNLIFSADEQTFAIDKSVLRWHEWDLKADAAGQIDMGKAHLVFDPIALHLRQSSIEDLRVELDLGTERLITASGNAIWHSDDRVWACDLATHDLPQIRPHCPAIADATPSAFRIDNASLLWQPGEAVWKIGVSVQGQEPGIGADLELHIGSDLSVDLTMAAAIGRTHLDLSGFSASRGDRAGTAASGLAGRAALPVEMTIWADLSDVNRSSRRGTASITARTELEAHGLAIHGTIDTGIEGGHIATSLDVQATPLGEPLGPWIGLAGDTDLDIAADPIHVEGAHFEGRISDLTRLSQGALWGDAESLTLDVSGPLDQLSASLSASVIGAKVAGLGAARRAEVTVATSRVHLADLFRGRLPATTRVRLRAAHANRHNHRIGRLVLDGTVFDRGSRIAATIDATATDANIVAGSRTAVIEWADTRATITLDRESWRWQRIAMGEYQVSSNGLMWRGRGGTVTRRPRGRLRIDQIVAVSSAGQFSVDGAVAIDRITDRVGKAGRDELLVGITSLDLATVARLFDIRLTGQASGLARIYREGKTWKIAGDAEFRELTWRDGAPSIEGSLRIDLHGRRLQLDASLREPGSASQLAVNLDLTPPVSLFDPVAWRQVELRDARRVRIAATEVELSSVQAIVGESFPILGRVGGVVELSRQDSDSELHIALTVADSTVKAGRRVYRGLSGQFSGVWREDGLTGQAVLNHDGSRLTSGTGTLAVALSSLWQERAHDPAALVGSASIQAELVFDDLDVARLFATGWLDTDRFSPPRAGPHQAIPRGRLSGRVAVTGQAANPVFATKDTRIADPSLLGVSLARIAFAGEISRRAAAGEIRVDQSDGGTVRAVGGYYPGRDSQLDFDLRARGLDLSFARVFAEKGPSILAGVGGEVDADLELTGNPDRPIVSGTVELRDGAIWLAAGSRRVHGISARFEVAADRIAVRRLAGYIDRGRLWANGRIDLVNSIPRRFRGSIRCAELALIWPEYAAATSGRAEILGGYKDGEIDAHLAVQQGARVNIREAGNSLQRVGELEDVVFSDGDRPADRIAPDARESGTAGAETLSINTPGIDPGSGHGGTQWANPIRIIRLRIAGPRRMRGVTAGIRVIFEADDEVTALVTSNPTLDLEFRDWKLVAIDGGLTTVRGEASVFDLKYRIDTGVFTWEGRSLVPAVDARLVREFPDATVTLEISGTLVSPKIQPKSDPPADETTVLAIMHGLPPEDAASIAYATVTAGADMFRDLRKKLPVRLDVVRIYPDGLAIGRWLSRNVLLGYRYRSEPKARQNRNEATLRWRLRRNLLLESHYGGDDIGGFDLLWRIRF